MLVSPASAVFNCSAREEGFAFPLGKARTNRANCGCVSVGAKWMLAIPEEVRSCAKLLSPAADPSGTRSEEHTSELQSRLHLVCRLLLEKKKSPSSPPACPAPTHPLQPSS